MACSGAPPSERLKALEEIEKEIVSVLQNSGNVLLELSKDKPVDRIVEKFSGAFNKSLDVVAQGLLEQIAYLSQVSTGQPHEGSAYSNQKDCQMAMHRFRHARSKLIALNELCEKALQDTDEPKQPETTQTQPCT